LLPVPGGSTGATAAAQAATGQQGEEEAEQMVSRIEWTLIMFHATEGNHRSMQSSGVRTAAVS